MGWPCHRLRRTGPAFKASVDQSEVELNQEPNFRIADLIAEAVVALEYRASAEDLSRMSHAHPTFAEAVKEAALDATAKRPLHL